MNVRAAGAALFVCMEVAVTAGCGGGGGGGGAMPHPGPTGPALSCSHTFSVARSPATFVQRAGTFGEHFPSGTQDSVAPGLLSVQFQSSKISLQAAAALTRIGAVQVGNINPQGFATFSVSSTQDPRLLATRLNGVNGITVAGPVHLRQKLQVNPNDPDYPNQWDLIQIGMPNAWSVTEGSSSVHIAVIDTGYDLGNPDLVGKVDASVVYDKGNGTVDSGASIEDKDGHGSDVSGIAAADTNNATEVAGTGWNIHLLEARVFPYNSNNASTTDIGAAINWAVSHHANVINLSLGGATADPTEENAVASAISSGVTVVAAAGNEGKDGLDFPAADAGVISVGASAFCDSTKNVYSGFEYVAGYSNFGPGLSLVAPGGDPDKAQQKCSTSSCIDFLQWIENLDSLQGPFTETVGLFAGTSQAAPHVAGAVALMISKDPSLTPGQALSIVTSTADNINDSHQGSGRLNVLKALNNTP